MPETYANPAPAATEITVVLSTHNDFLIFCKRFRLTMRSVTFIQFFNVVELIKLKLLHSQLNQIINQE